MAPCHLNLPVSNSDECRRRLGLVRQAFRLPKTLVALYRIVREDLQSTVLDGNLQVFQDFFDWPDHPHYGARRWQRVRISAIGPEQVTGMPVQELALMMHVAMEIEEPIFEYSQQNAEGFRRLMPKLSRFMGSRPDHEGENPSAHWCESPWCAEERRHSGAFGGAIRRLTGVQPESGNPNRPMIATPDREQALRLLISREAAEWNSSSTYIVMAAHARGELHTLMRNVARDEIKHLCILSAADCYVFGPRPWGRFVALVGKGLEEYRGHKARRSAGRMMGSNPVTAFEVVVCHFLTEYSIRRWLRSHSQRGLASIFETSPAPRRDPSH